MSARSRPNLGHIRQNFCANSAKLGPPLGAERILPRTAQRGALSRTTGHRRPVVAREPAILAGAARAAGAAELACRALGTLVAPAGAASKNEEPLLDRPALTWKAWRHRMRKTPEEPEWKETKEFVDTVRFRAEQLKDPVAIVIGGSRSPHGVGCWKHFVACGGSARGVPPLRCLHA